MLLSTDEQTLYLVADGGQYLLSINTTDGSVIRSIDSLSSLISIYSIDISDTYLLATGQTLTTVLDISTFQLQTSFSLLGLNALIMQDGGFLIVSYDLVSTMSLLKFGISGGTLWKWDFNFAEFFSTSGPDAVKIAGSNTSVFWMAIGNSPVKDQLVFGAVDFDGGHLFSF